MLGVIAMQLMWLMAVAILTTWIVMSWRATVGLARRVHALEDQARAGQASTAAPPAPPATTASATWPGVAEVADVVAAPVAPRPPPWSRATSAPPPTTPDSTGPAPAPSAPRGLEERAGKQWATWLGALALLGAGAYYFQLASGNGSLGPAAKLAIALGAALVAGLLGDRFVRRDVRLLGQALLGVGLGVGFGAVYAGFARYHLYPPTTGAAAMIAITAIGMTIAVRRDAPVIATLAVLGGYLTPALASDGSGARDVLFTYLMVLDVGVLAVALLRRWRGLEILAGLGTAALFAAWYHRAAEPGVAITLAWCLGFGALFVTLPLVHHLRRRIALRRPRIAMAIVAGAVTFAFGCEILDGVGRHLALLALALAAAYTAVAALTRRRLPDDGFAHAAFAAAAAAFATLALPLELRGRGLALAWAIEGPALLALGARYRLAAVRHLGAVAVALAVVRLFTAHWPLHTGPVVPFVNAELASAMMVAVAAGLYGWRGRAIAAAQLDPRGGWLALVAGAIGLALALGLVDRELIHAAARAADPGTPRLIELGWWLVVGGAVVAGGLRRGQAPSSLAWWTAAGATAIAAGLAIDVAALPPVGVVFANLRFALPVAACALAATLAWLGHRRGGDDATWAPLVGAGAALGLWLLVSHEAWAHARAGVDDDERARWLGHAALSCAWSAMAAITLVIGFARRHAAARVAGLALFGLAAAKMLLVDLARVEQGYRVLSLVVLGVLLLGVSWLYHRRGARG